MKWIKSSESLPSSDGTYLVKDTKRNIKKLLLFSVKPKQKGGLLMRGFSNIEWLDESTDETTYLKKIIELVEISSPIQKDAACKAIKALCEECLKN